jgi:HAD superfamily hydrolase (TIGR01509 family)
MSNLLAPIKGFLFDLDGTLLDTSEDLILALALLAANHQTEINKKSPQLWATLGKGGRAIVNSIFKLPENDPRLTELTEEFNLIYQKKLHDQAQFFPGMPELLNWLDQQQLPWGIVTNRDRAFTTPFPAHLAILEKSHCIICSSDVLNPKPHPESLLAASKLLKIVPEACAFMGDSYEDMLAGKQANMLTLFAAYGFSATDSNHKKIQPNYTLESPQALLNLLRQRSD